MAKKKPAQVSAQTAWEILWRNYIKLLRGPQTPANLDKLERIKAQIDGFDKAWLGLETKRPSLVRD